MNSTETISMQSYFDRHCLQSLNIKRIDTFPNIGFVRRRTVFGCPTETKTFRHPDLIGFAQKFPIPTNLTSSTIGFLIDNKKKKNLLVLLDRDYVDREMRRYKDKEHVEKHE